MVKDETSEEKIILKGEKALALWRQGRKAWNQWVEANPVADVDFRGIDFGQERTEKKPAIEFSEFCFPEGRVDFRNAQFGDGDVDFGCAQTGKGNINFIDTRFGEGDVNFGGVQFGEGSVHFNYAKFGKGNVDFSGIRFIKGGVYFIGVQFSNGDVNFSHTMFGEGDVNFHKAQFGEGNVNFGGVRFSKGSVDFRGVLFGEGELWFNCVKFGEGNYSFENLTFQGHVDFSTMIDIGQPINLSFKGACFDKTLDLSNSRMSCIIDLTATKTTNHISLAGLQCQMSMEKHKTFFQKVKDPADIAKLRRLKEIAEDNKDHERALEFHAQEMRAKRWHENTSFRGLVFDCLYDKLSNYGRSESRPFVCLAGLWLLFASIYSIMSGNTLIDTCQKVGAALAFSASQIIPVAPGSRFAQMQSLEVLFFNKMYLGLYLVTLLQSVLSIILLFLIGLALRNRFRV